MEKMSMQFLISLFLKKKPQQNQTGINTTRDGKVPLEYAVISPN